MVKRDLKELEESEASSFEEELASIEEEASEKEEEAAFTEEKDIQRGMASTISRLLKTKKGTILDKTKINKEIDEKILNAKAVKKLNKVQITFEKQVDVTDMAEREMKKIATRGVVMMLNAMRGEGITKDEFLNKIKTSSREKEEESSAMPEWTRDEFDVKQVGNNWDQESDSE